MGRVGKPLALAVCFVAGIAAAGPRAVSGSAADATTETATLTETTSTSVTTTASAETVTVATTATVEHATTQTVSVPATTAAAESSDSGTPAWVWALLAILAVALVVTIVLLATRGRQAGLSLEERGQRLDRAVGTWVAQGWAVESDTRDSAVLRRGTERMIISVDPAGQTTTRPG